MKPVFFGIVVVLLFPVFAFGADAAPVTGPDAAARYNEAGKLYRDSRFQEALKTYEELIASGIHNPDLYYNAANAAYRAEKLGRAVLYLERALRLAPSDREARSNLDFINSRKQDKDPSEDDAVLAFLERWYSSITSDSAALWSGLAFALMMFLAVGLLFLDGWKRIVLGVGAGVCGLLFLASTGILVHKAHQGATVEAAVIMVPEVHAYSGPGTENTLVFTLHEGTKVFLERAQDDWMLVRLKSGVGGWIESESLERI